MEAPIEVDVKVWVTDGEEYGQVTVGAAIGRYPTQEDVDSAISHAKEVIAKEEGFRVCKDPREFAEGVALVRTGQRVSFAMSAEWQKPYSSQGSSGKAGGE